MTREQTMRAFLAANGFGAAKVTPLAQDASFRLYWRLTGGPAPAVLMDAPAAREDVRPFLAIGRVLLQAGLSVPTVYAAEPEQGFVLLEDFGDCLYPGVLADHMPLLYDFATDALVRLGQVQAPPGSPSWAAPEMARATAATFLDWWWPAAFHEPASDAVRQEFDEAMRSMLAPLADQMPCLVHRDFFAGNLFWLPERAGVRRVGLIDFQDAALGHPAYDLVSLVQDARRDLPAELVERQIGRLLDARPDLLPAAFRAAFAICAAQRHLRVACLWVRLARRDGKPAYLEHGPRCWALLEQALRHPATAMLGAFMDRHVPAVMRGNPA